VLRGMEGRRYTHTAASSGGAGVLGSDVLCGFEWCDVLENSGGGPEKCGVGGKIPEATTRAWACKRMRSSFIGCSYVSKRCLPESLTRGGLQAASLSM